MQVHARRAVDCTFRVAACAVSKDDLPHMADWRPLRQAASDNLSGHTADGTVRANTEQAAPAAVGGRQFVGQCEFVFTGECLTSPRWAKHVCMMTAARIQTWAHGQAPAQLMHCKHVFGCAWGMLAANGVLEGQGWLLCCTASLCSVKGLTLLQGVQEAQLCQLAPCVLIRSCTVTAVEDRAVCRSVLL